MYPFFSYSNAAAPENSVRASISGAWVEKYSKPGMTSPSLIIGVGHFGRAEQHRTKQFTPIHLKEPDLALCRSDRHRHYTVPISRSIFQISGHTNQGLPYFTQFPEAGNQVSKEYCFLQLCPGFKYGGALISGDIPPEKRSVTGDVAENAEPLEALIQDGLEILLQGQAAAAQSNFWAPHYLFLFPKDRVLRVEYGGSQTFPRVVDYLYFNGSTLELKTPEQRVVENTW